MGDHELTCREVVELVNDYIDGVMPLEERVRLERHLDDCPHCVVYLEQMRTTVAAVGRLGEEELEAEVPADLLRAFRAWSRARPAAG